MKLAEHRTPLFLAFLLSSLSFVSSASVSQVRIIIPLTGLIKYFPQADIAVDFSKAIAVNNLSLAVCLGGRDFDFAKWRTDADLRQKVAAAGFGLVRILIPEIHPCTYWNETACRGEYDWEKFDLTIEKVLSVGSKPLFVIGVGNDDSGYKLPDGMIGNYNGTGFPSNKSYGAYVADLVKHTNVEKKWNVEYWEVWNEVDFINSSGGVDLQRIANFTKTFNNAAKYMHNVDSSILIGHGYSAIIPFFNYFLDNAQGLGFVSYHDYDAYSTLYFRKKYYSSNSKIIQKASVIGSNDPGIWKTYSPAEIRQKWLDRHGTYMPILITETNMNAAAINGTDPRIQTVFGAIWYAEKLRTAALDGILYSAYFLLASDYSPYWSTEPTRGYGFGMINISSPYTEWYPYWTNYLVGNHLVRGNGIYPSSTSNFTSVSTLAWLNNGHYHLLLVGKTESKFLVSIEIQNLQATKGAKTVIYTIDKNQNQTQTRSEYHDYSNPLTIILDGYSIVILQI